MDDVIDDLMRAARRCDRAVKRFEEASPPQFIKSLNSAIDAADAAASGSWLGYQSRIYMSDLRPKRPGEHFDSEWGSSLGGEWCEYSYDKIRDAIITHAGGTGDSVEKIGEAAKVVESIFDECRSDLLPTLDAVLRNDDDPKLRDVRDKIEKLKACHSQSDLVNSMMPRGQMIVRDTRAIQGGMQPPPHIAFQAWLISQCSASFQIRQLADEARYAAKYLEKAMKMKGKTVAKIDGPIFIGHGRSHVWKDLKEFITNRLGLHHEEFNRKPTAGMSTKERLLEMLDRCPFAFIVMTGEDEQKDETMHARANVIHEAGLFQGRYGFERAIILLEDECEEFSNVNGIGQIRFPKGDIEAKSEEIRRVLEREGLL